MLVPGYRISLYYAHVDSQTCSKWNLKYSKHMYFANLLDIESQKFTSKLLNMSLPALACSCREPLYTLRLSISARDLSASTGNNNVHRYSDTHPFLKARLY
jgi:hypothetical protein